MENWSYYKRLGTTAKISQARLEEKYLAAVSAHPKETEPENYALITEAYHTLRDPETRQQYDIIKDYNFDPNKLFYAAISTYKRGDHGQGDLLLHALLNQFQLSMMTLTSFIDEAVAEEQFDILPVIQHYALHRSHLDKESTAIICSVLAVNFLDYEYYDEVMTIGKILRETYPEYLNLAAVSLTLAYIHEDQYDTAVEILKQALPEANQETQLDIQVLLLWLRLLIEEEEWSKLPKVVAQTKKAIKSITDPVYTELTYDNLTEEYDYYYNEHLFKAAEVFLQLLATLTNNQDPEIWQGLTDIKHKIKLENEIERIAEDDQLFPLVTRDALNYYFTGVVPEKELALMNDLGLPPALKQEFEQDIEGYAAGILHLKRKFPSIYKAYQDKWDSRFDKLTAGLSRDQRRRLTKKK